MLVELLTIVVPAVGGGFATYATMWVTKRTGWQSQEARFESFRERVMQDAREDREKIHAENVALLARVHILERRDARVFIIEACLRMAVDRLAHIAPRDPVLRHLGLLLKQALPVEGNTPDDMATLLQRINQAADAEEAAR